MLTAPGACGWLESMYGGRRVGGVRPLMTPAQPVRRSRWPGRLDPWSAVGGP